MVGSAGLGVFLGREAGFGLIKVGLQGLLKGIDGLPHLPLFWAWNGTETLVEVLE